MMMMMMMMMVMMMMTETAVGGLGFTKYLESSVSKIGETAKLQCAIHSDGDAPQVAWSVCFLLLVFVLVLLLFPFPLSHTTRQQGTLSKRLCGTLSRGGVNQIQIQFT